jgi:hypothetical protein
VAATAPAAAPAKEPAQPAVTPAAPLSDRTSSPASAGLMSAADVMLLRDRLDAVIKGVATPDTGKPADPIVALVARSLTEVRAEHQTRLAALEKDLAAARQASEISVAGLRASLGDALAAMDATVKELAAARAREVGLSEELARAAKALARAEARIAELTEKPAADGTQPVGAEAFAELVDKFVGSLNSRMGSLSLAGGEMVLKAGVAATATGARFVLPSATGPTPGVLQELRLRLDPKS